MRSVPKDKDDPVDDSYTDEVAIQIGNVTSEVTIAEDRIQIGNVTFEVTVFEGEGGRTHIEIDGPDPVETIEAMGQFMKNSSWVSEMYRLEDEAGAP